MDRNEIIELIRTKYDPEPHDWPRHRGWDDGAEEIADAILASQGRAEIRVTSAAEIMSNFDAAIDAIKRA